MSAPAETGAGVRSLAVRPGDDAREIADIAVRFAEPAPAARCLGRFMDAAAAHLGVRRSTDAWWILARLPLDLGRELTELAGGAGYVRSGAAYLPDPGWGPPPDGSIADAVTESDLTTVPVLDLVTEAGLYRRPPVPSQEIAILAPAARATSLLRRALDMRLTATFRPVRLEPGLPAVTGAVSAPEPTVGRGTMIEVRLRTAGDRPHIPAALLRPLDDETGTLVCREAVPGLLIQHDRFSPLTDRQLRNALGAENWILADPAHGCWTFEPLADYTPAWELTTLSDCHRLTRGQPGWTEPGELAQLPDPEPLRVVQTKRADAPLDAILLNTSELRAARVLLEGHPLAEIAVLVPGRDHFLLLAGGGLADRVPLGRYLARVGPGPVYVAHGWRTEPELPVAAWRSLFGALDHQALVLEPDRTLLFDLSARRPVWELWAGEPPAVDDQIPDDVTSVLAELDAETSPAPPSRPAQPAEPDRPTTRRATGGIRRFMQRLSGRDPAALSQPSWDQQALAAELDGDALAAARLHDLYGDARRAAQLYEQAAREIDGRSPETGTGS